MLGVIAMSDVATIMIQGANDAEAEQALVYDTAFDRSDATVRQPRHCERHVENVLNIVIRRVAREVGRMLPAVEAREVLERLPYVAGSIALEKVLINAADLRLDSARIGRVDNISDIVLVAPVHSSGDCDVAAFMVGMCSLTTMNPALQRHGPAWLR
jgi:hypothetical protein